MKTNIWMPIYIGDYLSDTIGLTLAEHGAYLLSIMAYWRKRGPLTPAELDSICGPHAPRIALYYHKDADLWRHKRIDIELEISRQLKLAQQQRTEAARASKRPKPTPGRAELPLRPNFGLENPLPLHPL
jgi:uncharacterized protein YdaU (DUF1376 family)